MTPRKQNQIAERESAILRIAADIVSTEGVPALTMERVLARVDFSKGTLYNHFTCREDLLVAVHTQCFVDHLAFFERGAVFRGRPRERFMAAGMGHQVLKQLDPRPFQFALNEEILAAASDRWRTMFMDLSRETFGVFTGIVRDAMACGDLPPGTSPDMVAMAAWSLSCGAEDLYESGMIMRGSSEQDFNERRNRMSEVLLDGFNWRPLSSEVDYNVARQRIMSEVYGPEAQKLGLSRETAGV